MIRLARIKREAVFVAVKDRKVGPLKTLGVFRDLFGGDCSRDLKAVAGKYRGSSFNDTAAAQFSPGLVMDS